MERKEPVRPDPWLELPREMLAAWPTPLVKSYPVPPQTVDVLYGTVTKKGGR